ncbi:MAG: lipopolysaccharide biosynthesis protein [Symplocastrum torsivum CPER-KK1]|jgi:PST family polysaccharide transporter|uniref:Lipopolysaccharide biosynthesis protein n=1 Tax=Symplocastrum torsivum CPER-KK1 TaxID=450513 RepID=A0A951PK34_9CYAN|nr:lipopolysaccharide biosynthesis protein [Symplocastrum torsivum CPER-KK1]
MLVSKLKSLLSNPFIRNVGWLGGAELANRVFRLATTVTLARMFSSEDYGLMAVIYITFEFANVFTLRGGIGAKIVQADEENVKAIANTAYWLNWILCVAIFIIQCIAAFPIAHFYKNTQLILPLCTAALTYLMIPLFLVNTALLERENRLKVTAICNATQSFFSNTIIIILAVLDMGVWAIVFAMVFTTPVWIVISWMNHSWRPPKTFSLDMWQEVTTFGGNLLAIELVGKLRANIDYLIVGKFLGIDALGVYYFAFNAGLGISLNVINTFTSALFPYLCEVRSNTNQLRERFFSTLKKTSLIAIPLILLQASLAPFYVPIVFGQKWVTAIPILVVICLSALPLPVGNATYVLLNAVGKTHINLYWILTYTMIFGLFVLASVKWGIFWVAVSVLICQGLTPIYHIWAIKYALAKK